MNVAPVYRAVLKKLHKAARTRPHYLQDTRFLLSRTMVLPVPGNGTPTRMACSEADKNSKYPLASSYLDRPATECWRLDQKELFDVCKSDLRQLIDESSPFSGGNSNSNNNNNSIIAQSILRFRDLIWLNKRLDAVLSDATTELLETTLDVSRGPHEGDFIPDDLCDEVDDAKKDKRPPAATVLAISSAGAIGLQHEMFVLRRLEEFPMALYYLQGFNTIDTATLREKVNQHAALLKLVRETVPRRVVCRNEDCKLTVEVKPFDPDYMAGKTKQEIGYFATAHKQFMVHFSLEPSRAGAQIQIVNSYFTRLLLNISSLVEEVGYLYSRDVLKMLQQREGVVVSSSTSSAKQTPLAGMAVEDGMERTEQSSASCDFNLFFANEAEGPAVMKGMLHYRIADSEEDTRLAAIKVIPFGLLLMDSS